MRPAWLLPLYAWGVATVGVAGAAVVVVAHPPLEQLPVHPLPLLVLVAALVLGELFPIPVARGDATTSNVTISTTFAVALVVLGPLSVVLVAHLAAVLLDDARRHRPPLQMAFNAGQYALCLLGARFVWSALSGEAVLGGYSGFDAATLGAAVAAGVTFTFLNHVLVGIVVALSSAIPVERALVDDLRFTTETSVVLVGMALLTCLVAEHAIIMLPLVGLPILAVRRSAQMAALREQQAMRDPLTGLGNRASLQARMSRLPHRSPGTAAILLIDLDHFKDVNDSLGHEVGDRLLVEVATRLSSIAPAGAHVVRLGGDEFAVLVTGTGADARIVAESTAAGILDAMRTPVDVGGTRLAVQGSIGVAVLDTGTEAGDLLTHADIALYAAKAERARFSVYEPLQHGTDHEKLTLLTRLHDAVGAGRLEVAYQPQLDATDGRLRCVEALVRWHEDDLGPIPASTLVSLAENSGLIDQVFDHVLRTAARDAAMWRAAGSPVDVAVNLSARQLSDLALPQRVSAILSQNGLPPGSFVVEVTETSLLVDEKRADVVLEGLRQVGVRLSIDDFGTGHSSLRRLTDMAVDELKIDRSFVEDLASGRRDDVLVKTMVDLAANLGIETVAEGVQSEAVAARLAALGCDRLQGYYLSRPVSARAIQSMLVSAGAALPGWARASGTLALLPQPRRLHRTTG
ncbi:putative bifunctional diguanylate cyclase/phosphodiesterase [Aquipuribacter nitratireducens]|uniref:Bifunctional diguanylate cyclase/phosphodiesterase n=1 Tax=Aquipuribacter nitratireducens TaxID=650104 RepID=A0ABW0GIP0_9MICO